MNERLRYWELAPEGVAKMKGLEHSLNTEAGLEPTLLELVRLAIGLGRPNVLPDGPATRGAVTS
jgi:hypothetical protein